ncbi:MAG: hypothetical protein BRC23_01615 [Parcubacteria group bacterium SW_4_49_11]|nr:MAG: hypothetical protein BRC23_01615 [Parcubacteria group bacterium SW_4_49_11]
MVIITIYAYHTVQTRNEQGCTCLRSVLHVCHTLASEGLTLTTVDTTQFEHILQRFGYKRTQAKMRILYTLYTASKPLSISEIASQVRNFDASLNTSTVYRTVHQFYKDGLLKQISSGDVAPAYELGEPFRSYEHHHLICTKCGYMESFMCEPRHTPQQIMMNSPNFASYKTHSFEVFGVCTKCS